MSETRHGPDESTPVDLVTGSIESDVIVVGNGSPEFAEALKKTRPDQIVIDLFRLKGLEPTAIPAQYTGICW